MYKKDIDFSVGSILLLNKISYGSGEITHKGEYQVMHITNKTYKFVNTLTGELTNNPAILHKDEIPTITRNDYKKL